MKLKAKIAFEFEYDIDLRYYGTDIHEAIEMDRVYAKNNPFEFLESHNEKIITAQISEV